MESWLTDLAFPSIEVVFSLIEVVFLLIEATFSLTEVEIRYSKNYINVLIKLCSVFEDF